MPFWRLYSSTKELSIQGDTRMEVSVRLTAWGINGGTTKRSFSFNCRGLSFRVTRNISLHTKGNDVMFCMVVGRKFLYYVFGQDKFNGILFGTEIFHW